MSADEDNDLPSVKTLLQVLNTQGFSVHNEYIDIYIFFFIYIYILFLIVHWLFQAAWEKVEQSLVELSQTRCRVQQLQHQLQTLRREAELEVSATTEDLHNDTLAP